MPAAVFSVPGCCPERLQCHLNGDAVFSHFSVPLFFPRKETGQAPPGRPAFLEAAFGEDLELPFFRWVQLLPSAWIPVFFYV